MNKEELLSTLKVENYRTENQKISECESGVKVSCKDLQIDIFVGTHRSRLQNKNIAISLMENAIDNVLKNNETL